MRLNDDLNLKYQIWESQKSTFLYQLSKLNSQEFSAHSILISDPLHLQLKSSIITIITHLCKFHPWYIYKHKSGKIILIHTLLLIPFPCLSSQSLIVAHLSNCFLIRRKKEQIYIAICLILNVHFATKPQNPKINDAFHKP